MPASAALAALAAQGQGSDNYFGQKPDLLLMDGGRGQVSAAKAALAGTSLAEEGMTMLVVTHEMGFARNVSSKTVFMENGVVVEQSPSHEFFANPKEERTREFLRKIAHTE